MRMSSSRRQAGYGWKDASHLFVVGGEREAKPPEEA